MANGRNPWGSYSAHQMIPRLKRWADFEHQRAWNPEAYGKNDRRMFLNRGDMLDRVVELLEEATARGLLEAGVALGGKK